MWLKNADREFEVDDKSVDLIARLKAEGFTEFNPKGKKSASKPQEGGDNPNTGNDSGNGSASDSGSGSDDSGAATEE
jgi:hypothetical protein